MKEKPIWKRKITFTTSLEIYLADFGEGLVIFENGVWHNQWDSLLTEWEKKHNKEIPKWKKESLFENIKSEYDPFDENTSQITVFAQSRDFYNDEFRVFKLSEKQTEKIKRNKNENERNNTDDESKNIQN